MKLDPDIYRNAAELVASSTYCCIALRDCLNPLARYEELPSHEAVYLDRFASYFKPEERDDVWWLSEDNCNTQEARIFALLLMAEIVEGRNKAARKRKKKRP